MCFPITEAAAVNFFFIELKFSSVSVSDFGPLRFHFHRNILCRQFKILTFYDSTALGKRQTVCRKARKKKTTSNPPHTNHKLWFPAKTEPLSFWEKIFKKAAHKEVKKEGTQSFLGTIMRDAPRSLEPSSFGDVHLPHSFFALERSCFKTAWLEDQEDLSQCKGRMSCPTIHLWDMPWGMGEPLLSYGQHICTPWASQILQCVRKGKTLSTEHQKKGKCKVQRVHSLKIWPCP